jgi:hypothetical protein
MAVPPVEREKMKLMTTRQVIFVTILFIGGGRILDTLAICNKKNEYFSQWE